MTKELLIAFLKNEIRINQNILEDRQNSSSTRLMASSAKDAYRQVLKWVEELEEEKEANSLSDEKDMEKEAPK